MIERNNVAQELAAKDRHDWETLTPEMVSAYLHNADLVIEERGRAPVDEVNPKPLYTCDRCQDKAYIGGKPCLECNPVGLPVKEVHPGKLTIDNLDAAIATLKKEGKDPGYTDEKEVLITEETLEKAKAEIEQNARGIFETAIAQTSRDKGRIMGWEDMADSDREPFRAEALAKKEAETKRLKALEPKPHKHFYRKNGTCQCGQVKKVKKAK